MKRKTLLTGFMSAVALMIVSADDNGIASAEVEYKTFATIPYGSTQAQTRAIMNSKGYIFAKQSPSGADVFMGKIDNTTTDITAFYTETHVVQKFYVNIETSDDNARSTYDRLKAELIEKYGPPKSSFANFTSPYYDGDGYELSAIKIGKAHFATYWPQPDGSNYVGIEITKQLTVGIGYEGPGWSAYLDRMHAKTTKDL